MAIADILRNGVGTISTIIESVKEDVTLKAWIGQSGSGEDVYASPVTLQAFVEKKNKIQYSPTGSLIMTYATLIFVDPVADTTPNTGKKRQQPIDTRDIITLADGGTAPVVSAGGPDDPSTGRPFALEVVLGNALSSLSA